MPTGTFPEKTKLGLAVFEPVSEATINKGGHFEGEQIALETAVQDHVQFHEGWAYFDFQPGQKVSQAFAKEKCYACHVQHVVDDNVFVQFYPILRGVKASKAYPWGEVSQVVGCGWLSWYWDKVRRSRIVSGEGGLFTLPLG